MKILLVHNFYGSAAPSGENQVFEEERRMLLARGHEVAEVTRHSDEIRAQHQWGMLKGALATPWNPWMANEIRRAVCRIRPDIVHVHNSFPLISPSIFHAIGTRAARVLTLHNYRLFCPAGIPMRAGRVCTECMDVRSSVPALQHGCYRNSRLATAPLALSVQLHRFLQTWNRQIDGFIALSEFQRELMVGSGLPRSRVHVKPNFFSGSPSVLRWQERGNHAVFAGRLTSEKGVGTLIRAWRAWGDSAPELRIVGDGELRPALEREASGSRVCFLGQLSGSAAQAQIAGARLLILPSECFEGFPMVVREAFAFGTPAAVSHLGPLPNIVHDGENGLVFEAANPESLLEVVRSTWTRPGYLEQLGQGARREFEQKYTEDVNYEMLMDVYSRAQDVLVGQASGGDEP